MLIENLTVAIKIYYSSLQIIYIPRVVVRESLQIRT